MTKPTFAELVAAAVKEGDLGKAVSDMAALKAKLRKAWGDAPMSASVRALLDA